MVYRGGGEGEGEKGWFVGGPGGRLCLVRVNEVCSNEVVWEFRLRCHIAKRIPTETSKRQEGRKNGPYSKHENQDQDPTVGKGGKKSRNKVRRLISGGRTGFQTAELRTMPCCNSRLNHKIKIEKWWGVRQGVKKRRVSSANRWRSLFSSGKGTWVESMQVSSKQKKKRRMERVFELCSKQIRRMVSEQENEQLSTKKKKFTSGTSETWIE